MLSVAASLRLSFFPTFLKIDHIFFDILSRFCQFGVPMADVRHFLLAICLVVGIGVVIFIYSFDTPSETSLFEQPLQTHIHYSGNETALSNETELVVPIVFWTEFFEQHPLDVVTREAATCPFIKLKDNRKQQNDKTEKQGPSCLFSANWNDLDQAKVVVFHAPDLINLPFLHYFYQFHWNSAYFEGKVRVFWSEETEGNMWRYNFAFMVPKNFFHWMMTFHSASTVPLEYGPRFVSPEQTKKERLTGGSLDHPSLDSFNNESILAEKRIRGALWFVSHCDSLSRRETVVQRLQKYFRVDIGGRCGNATLCPRGQDCDKLKRQYYFYLALENDICSDYITEKFWEQIHLSVVPIVMHRSIYEGHVPADSFIALDDFRGPRALASHLNWLMENPDEYLRHFQWRKGWAVLPRNIPGHRTGFCRLCLTVLEQAAKDRDFSRKQTIIPDALAWYRTVLNCSDGKTFLNRWIE